MKKLALLLAAVMVICSLGSVTVFAADSWATGTGVEGDPYIITNATELAAMSTKTSAYYKITEDIDLTGVEWKPFEFKGYLDGNGHSITNLSVTATAQIFGLFTQISGATTVVENLTIASGYINGGEYNNMGAFAGKLLSGATLRNCVNYATVTGGQRIGGLIGQTEKYAATIEGCTNYGTVTATNKVGGIIGDVSNSGSITISNCANYGAITGTNAAGIGGNVTSSTVTDCYNEADVVYGIINNGSNTTVSNCLVNGNVTNVTSGTAANVYYCGTVSNANGATQVTEQQLADGTVTELLNAGRTGSDAPWTQVDGVPGVNTPSEDDGDDEPVVTAAEITGVTATTVNYAVTLADADKSAVVIVALYNGDQLFAVKTVSADETSAVFETTVGATNAKIFVWESLTTLKPIVMDEYGLQ